MSQRPGPVPASSAHRLAPWLAGALVAITILPYLPVLHNGFINYDDPLYVTDNLHVRDGLTLAGLRWALTAFAASNWHPLTWLSHMADVQVFGLYPLGHHLTSVLLHGVNSLLLFLFLYRTTGASWRSFFVALLFGVHPLHVESVAWIAERKDLPCGLFWLLTLLAYARYATHRNRGAYLAAVGCYTAAVLSKPMAVTLPLVLFILDYWPLRRWDRQLDSGQTAADSGLPGILGSHIREKLPFLLLAIIAGAATIAAQSRSGAIKAAPAWTDNLVHAITAYGAYLGKMVWPGHLVVLHPYAPQPLWMILCSAGCIAGVSALVWHWRDRRYLLVGWLWYLITLLPVSGIIRIGEHFIADRYTYLPLIGPFIMLCWGIGEMPATVRRLRAVAVAAGVAALCSFTVMTWRQTYYWRDSVVLLRHAVDHTHNNWMASHNLGQAYLDQWQTAEGLKWLQASVRINPSYPTAHNSLGIAYGRLGLQDQAIAALREAVRLDPGFAAARYNLVRAYLAAGKRQAAAAEYQLLKHIDPDQANLLQPYF